MKKSILCITIIFFVSINCLFAVNLEVSGITNPSAANGNYYLEGYTNDGKSVWKHESEDSYIYWNDSEYWLIGTSAGLGDGVDPVLASVYFYISSTDDTPPATGYSAINGTGDPLLVDLGASPTITFINGANASLNFTQTDASPPEDNWLLGQFSLAGDDTGATLNSVIVTLGGTYDSGDLQSTPFQLYAANSNSFGSASTLGSSVADPGSGSDVTFSSLSDALPSGTRYYWVTADVSATATGDDTINGTIDASGDLSITDGTLSGSSSYGKLSAGDDATLPVELSAFTAQIIESVPTLYWETQSETDNMGWFLYRNEENNFSSSERISDFIEGHGTTTQTQSYLYEDTIEDPVVGDVYYYWLESVDYSGLIHHYDKVAEMTITESNDPGTGSSVVPEKYGLLQNEPNPVVSSTRITFNLTETANVDLAVYNLKGQRVKTLYSGDTSKHTVVWDGRDDDEKELENGVYLYQLNINGKTEETKKLILMK